MFSIQRSVEGVQNAKERSNPQARQQATAQPPLGSLVRCATQLRQAETDREDEGIECVRLLACHGIPQAHIRDEMNVANEVKEQVADARRGEGCKKYPQPTMITKIPKKRWIKEMVDQKFLEIEIISVPELGECP